MSDPQTSKERRHSSPLLIVLATIGGLVLFGTAAMFLLVLWVSKGMVSTPLVHHGEKIGVVEIKGVIAEPEDKIKALREFRYDQKIKAVVVRVDSPGGAVGASQELYEEILMLDREKPVVASLGTVAASGGYYASLGARHIVANPGTVTGSIGVIAKIPNVQALLEKLGIKTTVIKSGSFKDMGSIVRDMTKEEKDLFEGVMKDLHQQFISAVAKSRKLPEEKVSVLADGSIMTGNQALDAKLVDETGNFSVAVERAAVLAGIEGRPELVYPRKDRLSILREIVEKGGADTMSRVLRWLMESPAGSPVAYEI